MSDNSQDMEEEVANADDGIVNKEDVSEKAVGELSAADGTDPEENEDKMEEDDDDNLAKKLRSIQVLPRIPKLKRSSDASGSNASNETSMAYRSILDKKETKPSQNYPKWPTSDGRFNEMLNKKARGEDNRKKLDKQAIANNRNRNGRNDSEYNKNKNLKFGVQEIQRAKELFGSAKTRKLTSEQLFDSAIGNDGKGSKQEKEKNSPQNSDELQKSSSKSLSSRKNDSQHSTSDTKNSSGSKSSNKNDKLTPVCDEPSLPPFSDLFPGVADKPSLSIGYNDSGAKPPPFKSLEDRLREKVKAGMPTALSSASLKSLCIESTENFSNCFDSNSMSQGGTPVVSNNEMGAKKISPIPSTMNTDQNPKDSKSDNRKRSRFEPREINADSTKVLLQNGNSTVATSEQMQSKFSKNNGQHLLNHTDDNKLQDSNSKIRNDVAMPTGQNSQNSTGDLLLPDVSTEVVDMDVAASPLSDNCISTYSGPDHVHVSSSRIDGSKPNRTAPSVRKVTFSCPEKVKSEKAPNKTSKKLHKGKPESSKQHQVCAYFLYHVY